MKVPAIKRYRPDWLKKKTKLITKSNKYEFIWLTIWNIHMIIYNNNNYYHYAFQA